MKDFLTISAYIWPPMKGMLHIPGVNILLSQFHREIAEAPGPFWIPLGDHIQGILRLCHVVFFHKSQIYAFFRSSFPYKRLLCIQYKINTYVFSLTFVTGAQAISLSWLGGKVIPPFLLTAYTEAPIFLFSVLNVMIQKHPGKFWIYSLLPKTSMLSLYRRG